LKGGIEYTFKRKWSTYLDIDWAFTSQKMSLVFDPPTNSVGISVPNKRVFETDPEANDIYGAVEVFEGGFVDGGSLQPTDPDALPPDVTAAEYCDLNPNACFLDPTQRDGNPDPGIYYIQSGVLDYENVTLSIGFRYTF